MVQNNLGSILKGVGVLRYGSTSDTRVSGVSGGSVRRLNPRVSRYHDPIVLESQTQQSENKIILEIVDFLQVCHILFPKILETCGCVKSAISTSFLAVNNHFFLRT